VGGIFHVAGAEDPVKRMVDWYNHERTHMSLLKGETPAQAFVRKMLPPGQTVIDEQTGEEYDVTSD